MGIPGGAAGFDTPKRSRRGEGGSLARRPIPPQPRRCGCGPDMSTLNRDVSPPHHPTRDHLQLKSCLKPSSYIFTKTTECATPLPPLHSRLNWRGSESPEHLGSSRASFMHWRRKWQPTPFVLARRIPGTGEPGGLPSMGSHRVGHD